MISQCGLEFSWTLLHTVASVRGNTKQYPVPWLSFFRSSPSLTLLPWRDSCHSIHDSVEGLRHHSHVHLFVLPVLPSLFHCCPLPPLVVWHEIRAQSSRPTHAHTSLFSCKPNSNLTQFHLSNTYSSSHVQCNEQHTPSPCVCNLRDCSAAEDLIGGGTVTLVQTMKTAVIFFSTWGRGYPFLKWWLGILL